MTHGMRHLAKGRSARASEKETTMKVRHLAFAASLGIVASTAFATELYHPTKNAEEGVTLRPDHMSSGLTREQVNATVMGAQRDGTLTWISRGYPARYPHAAGPNLTKTAEQVQQELRMWKANPVTADGLREVGGELGWVPAHIGR